MSGMRQNEACSRHVVSGWRGAHVLAPFDDRNLVHHHPMTSAVGGGRNVAGRDPHARGPNGLVLGQTRRGDR